jgi:hypothetical protein
MTISAPLIGSADMTRSIKDMLCRFRAFPRRRRHREGGAT